MHGKVMASGRGASGLVDYLTRERDGRGLAEYVTGDQHELGAVVYRNLLAAGPQEAAREMARTATLSERCAKPFLHLEISWHPSERPSDAQMVEALDRTLARMGLEDRQAVYAVHREKAHLHIHAAINRVGADGRAWAVWRSAERLEAASHAVERELGFVPREQFLRPERAHERVRVTAQQQRIAERSGIAPEASYQERLVAGRAQAAALAARVGEAARAGLQRAQNWEQAHAGLAVHNLGVRAYVHPKNPARVGLELVDLRTGERCGASVLGSAYGRAKLEQRLGAFAPGPSHARLEALRGVDAPRPDRSPAPERVRPAADRETPPPSSRVESPLWRAYQAARLERTAGRERALDRQRAHDRDRRAALREHAAKERAQLRGSGLYGAGAKAARAELAFAHAQRRAVLDATLAGERAELQRDFGARTWTQYVVERAGAGDNRAIAQLARWNRGNERSIEHAAICEQPREQVERTAPLARTLADLSYTVDRRTGDVTYAWTRDGRAAFTDIGAKIVLRDGTDRDAVRAVLQLSEAKWGTTIHLEGSEAFKRLATELATQMRITIDNRELQGYQRTLIAERELREQVERVRAEAHERARMERAEVAHREDLQRQERTRILDGRELEANRRLRPGIYHGARYLGELTIEGQEIAVVGIGERRIAFTRDALDGRVEGERFSLYRSGGREPDVIGSRAETEAVWEHDREQAARELRETGREMAHDQQIDRGMER